MVKGSNQSYQRETQQFRELVQSTARCAACRGRVGVMQVVFSPAGAAATWGCLKCRRLGFSAAGTPEFRASIERDFSKADYLKEYHDFH